MPQSQGTSFNADPLTFIVRHQLWDANVEDHTDQGVSIDVAADVDGKQTPLLRFNCFDLERSYVYGPENPELTTPGRVGDGMGVVGIHLELKGSVPGITEAKFHECAEDAKANCPISQLLKSALGTRTRIWAPSSATKDVGLNQVE